MRIAKPQSIFGHVLRQRCFCVSLSLIALIVMSPFVSDTLQGRVAVQVAQVPVLISVVMAVGRTTMPFVIALLLGLPARRLQLDAWR